MVRLTLAQSGRCLGDCSFESKPSPTSAHECGEVTGRMPAAKRSASVAPEVDLGECTLHSPLQQANKAEPLALKPRGTSPEIQNRGTSHPQKGHVSAKNF